MEVKRRVLTRDLLIKFQDRRYTETPVPWLAPGAVARIQSLTEAERAEIERQMSEDEDDSSSRTRLIIATLVDEEGARILSNAHKPFIEALDASAVGALVAAISAHVDLNGARLSLEDVAKN